MKIALLHKKIDAPVFAVPEFNYGQMQRWEGKERLRYSIEMSMSFFLESFGTYFEAFRQDEMTEDDTDGLEELEAYKEAGWPTLLELLEKNTQLLKELIMYHEYEVLHLLINNQVVGKLFYSINSIDTVEFNKNKIQLEGICFEVNTIH